jgi:hypothetical protein
LTTRWYARAERTDSAAASSKLRHRIGSVFLRD